VSSAARMKGPESNLWVWNPLKYTLRKHDIPANVIFRALPLVNMAVPIISM